MAIIDDDRRRDIARMKCDQCGSEYESTPYATLARFILKRPDLCEGCLEQSKTKDTDHEKTA